MDTQQDQRARLGIGRLIVDIDRQRPIGPDGKHGGRHTSTCGCERESRRERRRRLGLRWWQREPKSNRKCACGNWQPCSNPMCAPPTMPVPPPPPPSGKVTQK